jgi:hypothetical protein
MAYKPRLVVYACDPKYLGDRNRKQEANLGKVSGTISTKQNTTQKELGAWLKWYSVPSIFKTLGSTTTTVKKILSAGLKTYRY